MDKKGGYVSYLRRVRKGATAPRPETVYEIGQHLRELGVSSSAGIVALFVARQYGEIVRLLRTLAHNKDAARLALHLFTFVPLAVSDFPKLNEKAISTYCVDREPELDAMMQETRRPTTRRKLRASFLQHYRHEYASALWDARDHIRAARKWVRDIPDEKLSIIDIAWEQRTRLQHPVLPALRKAETMATLAQAALAAGASWTDTHRILQAWAHTIRDGVGIQGDPDDWFATQFIDVYFRILIGANP
jgi:hypothetical protein